MAIQGQLRNPPIKEALVDIRVPLLENFDQAMLAPLWPQLRDRYEHLEVRNSYKTDIKPKIGEVPGVATRDMGFHALVLRSTDGSWIAQFRRDGITVSQLAAYGSADDLFREAMALWTLYLDLVHPDRVVRIALRYINRLTLSYEGGEPLERFLNAPVTAPEGAPQTVMEFLTRTVLQVEPAEQTFAIVTQRLEAESTEGTPLVLDIDVIRTGEFEPTAAAMLPVVQRLRVVKNDLFFSYLTDEAIERYR
jgi:uncharacterized protein (TIGR04255 family)